MNSRFILGVHVSHDASACLIDNGRTVFAVQEERLTREKFYDGFPKLAIKFVLERAGIDPESEDLSIAIAGNLQHLENPLMVYLGRASKPKPVASFVAKICAGIEGRAGLDILKAQYFSEKHYKSYLHDEFESLGFTRDKLDLRFFDHHLCHAATAYYPAPYENALVFTQDGRGDLLSGTCYRGRGLELEKLHSQTSGDSLAQLYAGVTKFLGFVPLRHEGKVTGLAAFGEDSELLKKFCSLFEVGEEGEIQRQDLGCDADASADQLKVLKASPSEYRRFNEFGLKFQKWLEIECKDKSRELVAYAIQAASEEVMVESVLKVIEKHVAEDSIDIGVSGGLFANVKLNQRVRECSEKVNDVFVQPAMGDCGLSLGAAILEYQRQSGRRIETLLDVYLGNSYTDEEILIVLDDWESNIRFERSEYVEKEIGRLIHERKIVGRFNGKMEFGPRALGNRSILLHPRDHSMNLVVNKRLNRTEFMPFAPSVLDRRAKDYFVGYDPKHVTADWMTITYDVFEDRQKEIEAVVHVDGTARPQVVKAETNSSYYKILLEYERLSGIGCIVNTSFNMHEEPIVATPEDALRAFDHGSVDVLAIGNYLVTLK